MDRRHAAFLQTVDRLSGQHVEDCFHCHTCTAGCPASGSMRWGPDRLLRLIELGMEHDVLTSPDIWLCASCELCSARCPNGIEVANVIDTLRHLSLAKRLAGVGRRVWLFHRLYLALIERLGRSHELMLLGAYKLLAQDLFSDLPSGLGLLRRGKVPLRLQRIEDRRSIRRLFSAARLADAQGWEG